MNCVRLFALALLLTAVACGPVPWHVVGSSPLPSVVASIAVRVGGVARLPIPGAPAGAVRTVAVAQPAIVAAGVAADGSVTVTGLTTGSTVVTVTDVAGGDAVGTYAAPVTVTP